MNLLTLFCLSVLCIMSSATAKMKVASLHPLLSDIARAVGGDSVEVVDLVTSGANLHTFSPSPVALSKANGAKMYLAAGKGLENYLPKIQEMVGNEVSIIEVGKGVNSIVISNGSSLFACCPNHSHGSLDPHWWHSIPNLRRAAQIIAKEFTIADEANAEIYKNNAATYRRELDQLDQWVKKELSTVPKSQRYLVTPHAAFAYFCKEYGFKSIPVRGLTSEQSASAQYLAEANKIIKDKGIKAIFSEESNNPNELKVIAKATGAELGGSLYADGADSVTELFRHNVTEIVKALGN